MKRRAGKTCKKLSERQVPGKEEVVLLSSVLQGNYHLFVKICQIQK